MTIVEDARVITGGVDTHTGLHVAAALDRIGGLLGVQEFPATAAGYAELLGWLRSLGNLALAGAVEVVLLPACRPGPGSWHPPALPV